MIYGTFNHFAISQGDRGDEPKISFLIEIRSVEGNSKLSVFDHQHINNIQKRGEGGIGQNINLKRDQNAQPHDTLVIPKAKSKQENLNDKAYKEKVSTIQWEYFLLFFF